MKRDHVCSMCEINPLAWHGQFGHFAFISNGNHTVSSSFVFNLHEWVCQKAEIALAASASAIPACTGVTLSALVLHLNCTTLSQSKLSNIFMYIINYVITYSFFPKLHRSPRLIRLLYRLK